MGATASPHNILLAEAGEPPVSRWPWAQLGGWVLGELPLWALEREGTKVAPSMRPGLLRAEPRLQT